jgi:hypothetical protein
MRAGVAVASCFGIGLMLQGCGEGGQTDKASCLADTIDMVSQTMSGKVDVSVDVQFNGTTKTNQSSLTFKEMMDFEKFNIREDISQGEMMKGTAIINVDEKRMITYESVTVGGKSVKNCTIVKLPDTVPSSEQLAMMMDMYKPLLQKQADCGGNDGKYDTWKFSATNFSKPLPDDLPPKIHDLPIPSLDGMSIEDGLVSEDLLMTKDHLLHGSTTNVSAELKKGKETLGSLKVKLTLTVDEVAKGGPSAADLDPSQFDTDCTEVNVTMDMQDFLRSPGFARQQLLRIMEASKSSEPVLTV